MSHQVSDGGISMRKASFIIAIIAGILVFGIPFLSFAAEDTDPGYVSDTEAAALHICIKMCLPPV